MISLGRKSQNLLPFIIKELTDTEFSDQVKCLNTEQRYYDLMNSLGIIDTLTFTFIDNWAACNFLNIKDNM